MLEVRSTESWPAVRAVSAQEAALSYLRREMLAGRLKPGDRISQRDAGKAIGCSIVPVREALKVLEVEGEVRHMPQRGFFVAALDLRELREAYRMRELLEAEAISLAVPQLSQDDLEALATSVLRVSRAGQRGGVEEMAEANREFHFRLFDASGQERLCSVIRLLWRWTEAFRGLYYVEMRNRQRVDEEHRALLRAVARRDAVRAIELQAEHRRNTVVVLEKALGEGPGVDDSPPVGESLKMDLRGQGQ